MSSERLNASSTGTLQAILTVTEAGPWGDLVVQPVFADVVVLRSDSFWVRLRRDSSGRGAAAASGVLPGSGESVSN